MFKTILFVLALLMSYALGMSIGASKAHAEDHAPRHARHRTTSRTVTHPNTSDSIVFARGERFHNLVQFCRENPDHCVHVGNTYFLQ